MGLITGVADGCFDMMMMINKESASSSEMIVSHNYIVVHHCTSDQQLLLTSGDGSLLGLDVVGFSVGLVLMGRKDGSPLGGRVLYISSEKMEWNPEHTQSKCKVRFASTK